MSGDNRFEDYNEPGAMREFALELGVPDEDIVLDYAGRRTYDTCYRAQAIFLAGDAILVTGTLGDHGLAVMSRREGLAFESEIVSDVAPLWNLVRTLLDSFASIPPLTFRVTEGLGDLLMDLLTVSVELAIRVGSPTIVALLLTLLTLGFLSRTMPQLNILTIGFPIKLSIAMLVMAMTVMSLEPILLDTFTAGIDGLRSGLGLGPATR